jgi:hypothetical protein
VIPRCDENGTPEPRQLLAQKARRLRPRTFGFIEIAADDERVRVAAARFVHDTNESIREGRAPRGATSHVGKRRLEVDVRAVDERQHVLHRIGRSFRRG